jgi:biotin transporter BioY
MALGNLIIFFFGVSYLSSFVGISQAIFMGFLPFLIGDFLKLICATKILQRMQK